jgi:type IV pilus assembly protein PilY1
MKNTSTSKFHAAIIGFLLTLYAGIPAVADDTEIFTGANDTDSVRPNVLFVLDTSESMITIDPLETQTRLDRMKDALYSMLDTMTDVNVGLMRFSGDDAGGPVLFPVSYIDEDVCDIEDCSTIHPSIAVRVSNSADDAEEDNSSGAVDLTSTTLDMVSDGACHGTLLEISGSNVTDTEEDSGGSCGHHSGYSDQLRFQDRDSVGVRFDDVQIPDGATINCANVVFDVAEAGAGTLSMDIYGDDTNNSNEWDDPGMMGGHGGGSAQTISERTPTTASCNWNLTETGIDNPAAGESLTTPDMSDVVQEIYDRSGWHHGNSMAFMFMRNGNTWDSSHHRTVDSSAGSTPPKLRIYYDTSGGTASAQQTVGMRFQSVQIPQGATITSASLEFEVNDASSATTDLVIQGEDIDDSPAFTTTANDITNRTTTTSSVAWSVDNWTTPDAKDSTPDLSTVVQEIVNRSGWCGGNDMTFIISGTGQRSATSYDGTAGDAPLLRITYDTSSIPDGSGCMNSTYTKTVSDSSDDAEERLSDHSVNTASDDLDLVDDGGDQAIGVRFRNLDIEQGATVLSATLEFQVRDAGTGDIDLSIWGEDVDNASTYSATSNNISSRTKTSASVSWSSVSDPAVGDKLDSPDVTSIVQEVIDRGTWASGNDLAFIIEKSSGAGKRTVESFDGLSSGAAKLTVQVQWNTGGTSTTVQTVRGTLKSLIQDLEYKAGTPTVDALYEAARYFRGEGVDYGTVRGNDAATTDRSEYTRVSSPLTYTGGSVTRDGSCTDDDLNDPSCKDEAITGSPVYTSPIGDVCQTNHIVLLTDGNPASNSSSSKIQAMTGDTSCIESDEKACGKELVTYLYENDQSDDYSGVQNIVTYTIGFNYDDTWLQELSDATHTTHYTATNATDLVTVFDDILGSITTSTASFVAPGAAVNQFNRLRHNNDIYFSLFKPSDQPLWQGNLKKYTVDSDTLEIQDANDAAAVDDVTGFFKDSAKSYWSATTDGNEIDEGGAASKRILTRNTYTYLGVLDDLPYDLTAQPISEDNDNITKAMLGDDAMSDTKRTNILKWARGVDVKDYDEDGDTDEVRLQYADPLHSRPVIVTYGGTVDAPDSTVYYATNEGFLYAIDTDDGTERFNFIPKMLLENLDTLYDDSAADAHPYGLDGNITVWHDENNTPTDFTDDHIYLYVGMRRGGQNYYALDVTDRDHPELMWQITGGTDTDYTELGQTWSAPVLTKVRISSTEKEVLIFGGGYDTDQDGYTSRTADSQGNAIYIVNALTGAREWWASDSGATENFSDMQYSIPGNVRVIDSNVDGYADLLYFADMGGQVWRLDIDNYASSLSNLVSGVVLADLASESGTSPVDPEANRRFYNTPDIAKVKDGSSYIYTVAIGSGFRAHPLNDDVTDRFYMIRDTNFNTPPPTSGGDAWVAITNDDLYDATDDTTSTSVLSAIAGGKKGWRIDLENTGEKVLSDSVTLNNQIVFSTYTPTASTSDCSAAQGTGRTYAVNLADATPSVNLDTTTTGTLTKSDRVVELKRGGIPPKPTVLMLPDPVVLIGPETPLKEMSFGDLSQRTFWYQVED